VKPIAEDLLSEAQRQKYREFSKNIWGKCFCFNQLFEKENHKKCLFLIKRIRLLGGYYCNKIGKADFFVGGKDGCLRQSQLPKLKEDGNDIAVISEEQICAMLGIGFEEYCDAEYMSITKIKAYIKI
ncbi:MAG: hypothetical protein RR338_06460, partial [Clostridia bacterium]